MATTASPPTTLSAMPPAAFMSMLRPGAPTPLFSGMITPSAILWKRKLPSSMWIPGPSPSTKNPGGIIEDDETALKPTGAFGSRPRHAALKARMGKPDPKELADPIMP